LLIGEGIGGEWNGMSVPPLNILTVGTVVVGTMIVGTVVVVFNSIHPIYLTVL